MKCGRLLLARWLGLLVVVFTLGATQVFAAAPAGNIIDIVGEVQVTRSAVKGKAGLFDNLFAGDVVRVPDGARLVFTHNVAKVEYSAGSPVEFEMTAEGIKLRSGAKPVAKNLAELAALSLGIDSSKGRQTVGAVRMRGMPPPQTTPADGETVLTRSPLFSWTGTDGIGAYQIGVKKSGGSQLLETTVNKPVYQVAGEGLLEWGGSYQWFVSAEQGGQRVNIARSFKVVDAQDREMLERLKPAADGEFSAWVIYAKALDHLGAASEARVVWGRLASQRPDNAALEALARGK